ncbi:MAG: type I methionyl aminopeptidase [Patescibacteria group bacterium]|mgnify:CR=1 FL=1
MAYSIKTPEDIAVLREGGARLARVVDEVARMVRPGISVHDLDKKAEELIRAGGDEPAFLGYTPRGAKRTYPATMCISVNEEVVHGIPTEDPRILKEGDIVSLDCGVAHKKLITDHAVTVIAGGGDEQARALVSATKEALDVAIGVARAGAHVGDIGAAVEAVAARHHFGVAYQLGGHGVGYEVHEEPYVGNTGDRGTGEVLVPGMILALEPIFTEGMDGRVRLLKDGYTYVTRDGTRAAHFEHTILITDGAAEILTVLK